MRLAIAILLLLLQPGRAHAEALWSHLRAPSELRGMTGEFRDDRLQLTAQPGPSGYRWAVLPAPEGGWNLGERAAVEADIANTGTAKLRVMFWVVGDRGWDAVPAETILEPGATSQVSCNLRETWPDGTPKIDPNRVKQIQIMVIGKLAASAQLEVRDLQASGTAEPWQRPAARLEVPLVEDGAPAPGRRVRFRLPSDDATAIYSILHLPEDWKPGGSYPVIAELPGNIFFVPGCYSTGLPDQCVIGFGMTKGRGAICLGLPFVDRATSSIAEDGWGNADDTAAYAVRMVEEVCTKFGGDRHNVVLTGFSRGALACGFIGLRDDRIAALWKGFHACQHYDGDGWRGATMEGAIERAKRFRGKAVFQTDNSEKAFRPVMDAMRTQVTYARSGLGAHATAMFLDDRPSTLQLRDWFWKLVAKTPSPDPAPKSP